MAPAWRARRSAPSVTRSTGAGRAGPVPAVPGGRAANARPRASRRRAGAHRPRRLSQGRRLVGAPPTRAAPPLRPWGGDPAPRRHDADLLLPSEPPKHQHWQAHASDVAGDLPTGAGAARSLARPRAPAVDLTGLGLGHAGRGRGRADPQPALHFAHAARVERGRAVTGARNIFDGDGIEARLRVGGAHCLAAVRDELGMRRVVTRVLEELVFVDLHGFEVQLEQGIVAVRPNAVAELEHDTLDRKSTRLNSSHLVISYAVFCLKKKKRKREFSV